MHVLLHGHPTSTYADTLKMLDHSVEVAESALDIELWLYRAIYSVVVVDPFSENGTGALWARSARAAKNTIPIVFATAAPVADATPLLRDADDVIRLPMGAQEFVARLQAIVRRARGYASSTLQIGDLRLDQDTLSASYCGAHVALPKTAARLLECLMLRQGKTATKQMILSDLYGGRDEPELKIIDVLVCRIRAELRRVGAPADVIRTVWGRGYLIERPASSAPAKAAA